MEFSARRGCPADLRWDVEPSEATLKVGGTFAAEARAFGCGGSEEWPVDMRWTSSNADVLSVGRESGHVVAVAVGDALVVGTDLGVYAIGPVEISVRVVE